MGQIPPLSVCRNLKNDIVGLAVLVGNIFRRKSLALFKLHDLGDGQLGPPDGIADEYILDRDGYHFVGETVDADIRGNFVAVLVGQFYDLSEIAGLAEDILLLFGELISLKLLVELGPRGG